MITEINKVPLYIASRDEVREDIMVYPETGDIRKDNADYYSSFREYIRDNKLYVIIDGIMYNKAKLIYDSVNRNNLPSKRYKVLVQGDITHPNIHNIIVTDLNYKDDVVNTFDESINILYNDIDTNISIEYLLQQLVSKKYKVIDNEVSNE